MIRVVAFLISVALIAVGVAWVADRPGDVAITWMDYRIETSVLVAAVALLVLVIAAIILWSILRGILRSPQHVSLFLRHRRAMKGYHAISRGLIAIGAGDHRVARKSADEARAGSRRMSRWRCCSARSRRRWPATAAAPKAAFRAMLRREETKLLGLRGLYVEAQRRDDPHAALAAAEEAAKVEPSLSWASQAVLDFRSAARDWRGALDALERMKSSLEKHVYRRKRAVLLTAHALALNESDRDASRAAVLEAVKLAPDLVPAAALAGGGWPKPARCARPEKFSPRPGPPIRIPTSPRPTPTCVSATARANAWRGSSAWPKKYRVTSKARWRWRVPRSRRATLRRRARRLPLISRRRRGASPR